MSRNKKQNIPSRESVPKQETVLDAAARITSGDRQRDYGNSYDNHERIMRMWNAYLDCRAFRKNLFEELTPADIATMMILLKIARNVFTPTRDNIVDICGYARCLEQIAEYQKGDEL